MQMSTIKFKNLKSTTETYFFLEGKMAHKSAYDYRLVDDEATLKEAFSELKARFFQPMRALTRSLKVKSIR